jgi:Tfp pilus assembly PilM family ATPase
VAQVGLEKPVEEIEGDPETVAGVREALEEGTSKLADELRLSLEFYAAQEGAPKIERAVLSGAGSMIEGISERLSERLGLPFASARPAALEHFAQAEAARLTLGYGLALDRLATAAGGAGEAS